MVMFLGVFLVVGFFVFKSIFSFLCEIIDNIFSLVNGDLSIILLGVDWMDEIGEISCVVQGFKESVLE